MEWPSYPQLSMSLRSATAKAFAHIALCPRTTGQFRVHRTLAGDHPKIGPGTAAGFEDSYVFAAPERQRKKMAAEKAKEFLVGVASLRREAMLAIALLIPRFADKVWTCV